MFPYMPFKGPYMLSVPKCSDRPFKYTQQRSGWLISYFRFFGGGLKVLLTTVSALNADLYCVMHEKHSGRTHVFLTYIKHIKHITTYIEPIKTYI